MPAVAAAPAHHAAEQALPAVADAERAVDEGLDLDRRRFAERGEIFARQLARGVMRVKPCAARNRAASALCPENWVLACSGMVGIFSRISAAAPISAMISASTPASSRKAA